MQLFQWNDSYSVNNQKIDNQHQKLVSTINKLAESMAGGQGKDVLGKIIDELVEYTITHFQTEEQLFEASNYQESKTHMREHKDFVQKITEFKDDFDNGRLGVSVSVLNFLCDWLKHHILVSDKKYVHMLKNA